MIEVHAHNHQYINMTKYKTNTTLYIEFQEILATLPSSNTYKSVNSAELIFKLYMLQMTSQKQHNFSFFFQLAGENTAL